MGHSLMGIDFVLMNACMQGPTHSHILLDQVVSCYNYSALLSTSLLPAASPFSASQFVDVVNAKQSLFKLRCRGVISQAVRASIEATKDDEDAKYLLLEHLEKNSTVDTEGILQNCHCS